MTIEISKKTFVGPDDLVNMGLYTDTGHVFRAVKNHTNVPPHVRLSKKNIRFPLDDLQKWLLEKIDGAKEATHSNRRLT